MHYVKHFNFGGVETTQVSCIELQGAPHAATEGAVGLLGMDMTSPTHDLYRCVAVNGSVYTWELLSAGLSVVNAKVSKSGANPTTFSYSDLRMPARYTPRVGDLVLDSDAFLYQITELGSESCAAAYCDMSLGAPSTLVSEVADHAGRLTTLEGDENTDGSVAKKVKDALGTLPSDVADHAGRLTTLEGDENTDGSVAKKVKDALASNPPVGSAKDIKLGAPITFTKAFGYY